ncbi:VOC family protein [Maribacter sp. 4G9]|uniref:VOC family protein n=1 Tax=Maribacter sp. 4G9 TaxID=1889777 RepID=UPI000C15206A|nr:VOC family protein [Maribacter sp. 4G9]PIB39306.1 hypothetical protein BFP75_12015 [Maribacter sp. 4G9]
MRIEHLAIWVMDLERMRNFYEDFFGATSGSKYVNERKGFSSYFLSFHGGPRLELMHRPDVSEKILKHDVTEESLGLIHFAISVGSKEKVDSLTEHLKQTGIQVLGEPRTTGDGYYESLVVDPEGNKIEITV